MRWSAEVVLDTFKYLDEGIRSLCNKYAVENKAGLRIALKKGFKIKITLKNQRYGVGNRTKFNKINMKKFICVIKIDCSLQTGGKGCHPDGPGQA